MTDDTQDERVIVEQRVEYVGGHLDGGSVWLQKNCIPATLNAVIGVYELRDHPMRPGRRCYVWRVVEPPEWYRG